MKSGQILILVLLIVVVALAVGLSVASRNIVNLRTSTQTKESQRAFGAAEGGVEDVLSKLTKISSDIKLGTSTSGCSVVGSTATCSVPVSSDITASVNVKGSKVYESKVELGEVGQIDLTGLVNPPASQVEVHWAKGSAENSNGGPASLEIGQLYGSSSYGMMRWYVPNPSTRPNETLGINTFGTSSCPSPPSDGYTQCIRVAVTSSTPLALRIKPFWASTTVKVFGVGFDLPVQTYDISSSASSNAGVTRAVQVKRTALPMMPAIFDYTMFSEGDILK